MSKLLVLSFLLLAFSCASTGQKGSKNSVAESQNLTPDQIRALKKITTVRNVTPPEYMMQSTSEHHIITIKFVTRGDAKQDLEQIKNDILTQSKDRIDLRIPGQIIILNE